MSPLTCSDVADCLPVIVDSSADVPQGAALAPEVWEHTRTCLRCQAELVRYRQLLRSLRTLRNERILPGPGSLRFTLEALAEVEPARPGGRRAVAVAYIGGAVVATAASAAGMLVWATRRRMALAS
jgi:hypothetical protein